MAKKVVKEILKGGQITFVALCPRGANYLQAVYKAEGGVVMQHALLKATPEQVEKGEVLALVYAPGRVDADGEWAGAEVVKELAYSHARNGLRLNVQHGDEILTPDQAYVAETFLVQKGDPRFKDAVDVDGNKVEAEGAWAQVIKLLDPKLKSLYKEGGWAGVSMEGAAPKKAGEPPIKKEGDMNEEQIKTVAEAVAKAVVAGVAPLLKAKEPETVVKAQEDEDLTFKGDPTSLKDVRAHRAKLAKAQAKAQAKDLDWTDPEVVEAYEEGLQKAEEERRAEASSAQGLDEDDADPRTAEVAPRLRKATQLGLSMADSINLRRGFAVKK